MFVGTASQTAMSPQNTGPSTPGAGSSIARRCFLPPNSQPNSSQATNPVASMCSVIVDSAMPSTPRSNTTRPTAGPATAARDCAASTGLSRTPSYAGSRWIVFAAAMTIRLAARTYGTKVPVHRSNRASDRCSLDQPRASSE